jgi:hypothetical protein
MIPPLLIPAPLVRGGPALQRVNPKAISYVEGSGLRFEDVYPEGISELRAIAPNLIVDGRVTEAAREFVQASDLPFGAIYPEHGDMIVLRETKEKRSPGKLRVAAAVAGFAAGACLVGPLGAAVGAFAMWLAGGRL